MQLWPSTPQVSYEQASSSANNYNFFFKLIFKNFPKKQQIVRTQHSVHTFMILIPQTGGFVCWRGARGCGCTHTQLVLSLFTLFGLCGLGSCILGRVSGWHFPGCFNSNVSLGRERKIRPCSLLNSVSSAIIWGSCAGGSLWFILHKMNRLLSIYCSAFLLVLNDYLCYI